MDFVTVYDYQDNATRSLELTLPFVGASYYPGTITAVTSHTGTHLFTASEFQADGNLFEYRGGDIALPASAIIDYPAAQGMSTLNFLLPVGGLGYSVGEHLLVSRGWTLSGTNLSGFASVSRYPQGEPWKRYLLFADLADPAFQDASRDHRVVPAKTVPWDAPMGGGSYFRIGDRAILHLRWGEFQDNVILYDLGTDTWKIFTAPSWEVAWHGWTETHLYFLVIQSGAEYRFTLNRVDLVKAADPTSLTESPVEVLWTKVFNQTYPGYYPTFFIRGDRLYVFDGSCCYPPSWGGFLERLLIFDFPGGALLGSQDIGYAAPSPYVTVDVIQHPDFGPFALYASALVDVPGRSIFLLDLDALAQQIREVTGWSAEDNCCWSTIHVVDYAPPNLGLLALTAVNGTLHMTSLEASFAGPLPVASFTYTPAWSRPGEPTAFDASASHGPGSGSEPLEYRWDWDGDGAWDTNWSSEPTGVHVFQSDGTYGVRLQVRTSLGATASFRQEVVVDSTPPEVSLKVTGTIGDGGWYTSPATAGLSATDRGSGVASLSFRLDGGAWRLYDGPVDVRSEGEHWLEYSADDIAGNRGPVETARIPIDVTVPVFGNTAPSGVVTSGLVTLQWSATDAPSGLRGFEVSLDGGPYESLGMRTNLTVTLSDGFHVVRIRAADVAGNFAVAEILFRVDTNIFSTTGPYGGVPLLLIVAAITSLGFITIRRLRGRRPPSV